ncbi:hypothetical protein B0H14DRAFT_3149769 [Mycena olivaceomarginata]|nr:hypothetical protein B0H14DRAFT_3149769 [Mycena olivaceomarginata]
MSISEHGSAVMIRHHDTLRNLITDSLCRTADESFCIKEEEERSTCEEPKYPRLGQLPTWFWQQNQRRESPTCSTESWGYGPSDAAATCRPYYEYSHSGQEHATTLCKPSLHLATQTVLSLLAIQNPLPHKWVGSTAHRDISPDEFARLSKQFEYIEEHDEHADIAAGDPLIDESLGDNVPDSAESNAAAAEAETQSSEPAPSSVIHKQLTTIQERLLEEESTHGKPLCYLHGDFFDRPPHPVFTLQKTQNTTGLDPSQLYLRKVFVWLPYLLPGCPDRFKCTCGKPLSKNGFNDNPIAHRVCAMPSDFFLFTNRFICDSRRVNSPGCGTSYQGTDSHIISQLPHFVQAAFPAYISARGAISKLMMWQMSNTFATRFGPAPFSELVSEISTDSMLTENSSFDDPNGYAGSPPSVQYIKALFTDDLTAHRIYIEQDIATLPLTFLKHMGGMKGEHVFTAAYTVLNEFEEVRAHSLTLTKSLLFVKDMFDGIQRGLKDSNNPPTEILYTDSPQSERTFHESINSALTKNVEPVTEWSDLPPFIRAPGVVTVSISDSMDIESMSNDILIDVGAADLSSQLYLVALAIKTEQLPGATLTSRSHVLPSLRAILTNPSIIKIGHSIRQTLETIAKAFSLPEINKIVKAKNAPILELGKYAKLKGVVDGPTVSLHALAGAVLHNSFSIPHFPPIHVMDDKGHTKRINISASRSLIEISEVHFIHCTRIQWSGLLPMEPKLSSPHPSFTLGVMFLQFHPILLLAYMLFQHR